MVLSYKAQNSLGPVYLKEPPTITVAYLHTRENGTLVIDSNWEMSWCRVVFYHMLMTCGTFRLLSKMFLDMVLVRSSLDILSWFSGSWPPSGSSQHWRLCTKHNKLFIGMLRFADSDLWHERENYIFFVSVPEICFSTQASSYSYSYSYSSRRSVMSSWPICQSAGKGNHFLKTFTMLTMMSVTM